jgi:hypothetical protein
MTTAHYKRIGNETWKEAARRYAKTWYAKHWKKSRISRHDVNECRRFGRTAEELAEQMLPKLGFGNIVHVSKYHAYIPMDFYAEKDGKKCIIEVTTVNSKCLQHSNMLAELFNARLFVLCIKPDFSTYLLREIPYGKSSTYINVKDMKKMENLL